MVCHKPGRSCRPARAASVAASELSIMNPVPRSADKVKMQGEEEVRERGGIFALQCLADELPVGWWRIEQQFASFPPPPLHLLPPHPPIPTPRARARPPAAAGAAGAFPNRAVFGRDHRITP